MDLKKLFADVLTDKEIALIEASYDEYKNKDLSSLGIDSLYIMKLVLNIEQHLLNKAIDYSSFSMEQVSSISKIEEFVKQNNARS